MTDDSNRTQASSKAPAKIPGPAFAAADHYVSREFNQLEQSRLWQRVWQVACREEQIPRLGNFVRYDVVDQSIIVLRGDDGVIRAFHNLCRYCGNALVAQERGTLTRFNCSSDCWQWTFQRSALPNKDCDREVTNLRIEIESLGLKHVLVDTWGGFVFVTMDVDAEPLMEFLDPVPKYLDRVKLGEMTLRCAITVQITAKWLTALTASIESGYFREKHIKMLLDDMSAESVHRCDHAFGSADAPPVSFLSEGASNDRLPQAFMRMFDEVPAGAPPAEVYRMVMQVIGDAAENREARDCAEWNIFPNIACAHSSNTAIFCRARPDSTDVDSCLFDIWILQRAAPERLPAIQYVTYDGRQPHRSVVLDRFLQHVHDLEQAQLQMNALGFTSARSKSLQEMQASNIHRSLHDYIYGSQSPSDRAVRAEMAR